MLTWITAHFIQSILRTVAVLTSRSVILKSQATPVHIRLFNATTVLIKGCRILQTKHSCDYSHYTCKTIRRQHAVA